MNKKLGTMIKNIPHHFLIFIIFIHYLPLYFTQQTSGNKNYPDFIPKSALADLDMVLRNSTIKFLENFFDYDINATTGCDIWNYTQIYQYSFMMDNTLGDYSSCLKDDDTWYFFFVLIPNDTLTQDSFKINLDEGFSYYFKDLLYTQNYIFSMCVPTCIVYFKDSFKTNPFNLTHDEGKSFLMKSYNAQQIYILYYDKDLIINYFMFGVYYSFLGISLFFALFPNLESLKYLGRFIKEIFCCCFYLNKKKKKIAFINGEINQDYSKGLSQIQDSNLKNEIRKMKNMEEQDLHNSFDRDRYYNTEDEDINLNNQSDQFNDVSQFPVRRNLQISVDNDTKMESDLIFQPTSIPESGNSSNNKNYRKIYKVIASIFSLTKNIKRIFKATNQKNKIHSSYINDDSLAFLNGCKAINLFCLTYCSIFWIFIESPNTKYDKLIKVDILTQNNFTLPIVYYLYWSIYLTFAFNGFSFGYKFLSHMNSRHMDSETDNSRDNFKLTIKKVLSFVLPLFFKYVLYIFLIFNVYNIQYLINLGSSKSAKDYPGYGTGPLFYIYKEISNYTLEHLQYFLMLYANFKMDDTKLTKTSIYVFFFVFINETQYFFISLIMLLIYYYKKNLGLIILILAYIVSMVLRAIYVVFGDMKIIGTYGYVRDFFGIEIYSFRFFYGLPVYFVGVIFGVLYFEYNTVDDLGITSSYINEPYNSTGENLSYSDYLKHLNGSQERYANKFIKFLANSKFLQFVLLITSATTLFVFFLYDNLVLFSNIRENGFKDYKYSWWEKLYSFIELDLLAILIFLLVFKFVIFNNFQLRKFLSSNFWIPFSRLYFVIACLLSPITYFFILNLDYPIKFKYTNVLFLSLSVLFLLYFIGFFISLLVEVPLKVGFKKIVNLCLAENKSLIGSEIDCSNNIQTSAENTNNSNKRN
jgi:hypothetical protein